jgi:hypothetical protein
MGPLCLAIITRPSIVIKNFGSAGTRTSRRTCMSVPVPALRPRASLTRSLGPTRSHAASTPPADPTWRLQPVRQSVFRDRQPATGYPRQLFGLQRMLELDGERRDSRFILVRALDRNRVIAFTFSRR